MASPAPATAPVGPSSLITVKVLYNENTRRFKLPLRELGARTLPQNVCSSPLKLRSELRVLGPPIKNHSHPPSFIPSMH